jgi:hypothetical protein
MKHVHLRKDKTCLNCGTTVTERYCSHCGQENIEPKESFAHLLGHFFADVTHYDAQVFTTIKDLVIRPGFLTNAYNAGKRTSYLNPIRMYIFISALFFILAFSFHEEPEKAKPVTNTSQIINPYRQHLADSLRKLSKAASPKDSVRNSIYSGLAIHLDTMKSKNSGESLNANINNHGIINFHLTEYKYANNRQYDSAQRKMTDTERNGLIATYISHKMIHLTREQGRNDVDINNDITHDLPKLMFVLLPLFALYIRLFYNRKKYLYSQHAIFSLHFHCFMFLSFLLVTVITMVFTSDKAEWILSGISLLAIFIYLAVALRNVYNEALWLSFIKSVAISLIYTLTLVICLSILICINFVLL